MVLFVVDTVLLRNGKVNVKKTGEFSMRYYYLNLFSVGKRTLKTERFCSLFNLTQIKRSLFF